MRLEERGMDEDLKCWRGHDPPHPILTSFMASLVVTGLLRQS